MSAYLKRINLKY